MTIVLTLSVRNYEKNINYEYTYLIGNGCVVNLPELVDEIKKNESRGVNNWAGRLLISDRAHLGTTLFIIHGINGDIVTIVFMF